MPLFRRKGTSVVHYDVNKQPKKFRRPMSKVVLLSTLILLLTTVSQLTRRFSSRWSIQQSHADGPPRTTYYSVARLDQAGATIHDMLLAHAYVFKLKDGGEYGGACLRYVPMYPRRGIVALVQHMKWNKAIPFHCPAGNENYIFLEEDTYRKHDGSLFTPAWKLAFEKQTRPSPAKQSDAEFRIAVHIRRGDVNPCHLSNRYLSNSHYVELIRRYSPPEKRVVVTIYSESNSYESFDVFKEKNFTLALDGSLHSAWQDLATANVAILSKSSFSYAPAVLNPNVVVYTEFWHSPLAGWDLAPHELLNRTNTEIEKLKIEACRVLPPRKRGFWKRRVLPLIRNLIMQPT